MTGKPSLTIEELLDRYERYDAKRRDMHQVHPTKAGFVEGFPDVGLGKSKQTLANYEHRHNLPWPLLPEDPTALVFVIFGQPPFDLTWVSRSLAETLGYPREELVGRESNVLRRGVPFDAAEMALLSRLKLDDAARSACIDRTYLVTIGGLYVPVRQQVRYCGEQSDRFYCHADVLGPPCAAGQDAELFNVYPDYVFEMKRPSAMSSALPVALRYVPALHQLTGYEDALIAQLTRMRNDPEYMRRFIDKAIGTYRPPELPDGEASA